MSLVRAIRPRSLWPALIVAVLVTPAFPLTVNITAPTAGNTFTAGNTIPPANPTTSTNITWTAAAPVTFPTRSDVYLSLDEGATFKPVALNVVDGDANSSLTWWPPNRPTTKARIRVIIKDADNRNAQATTGNFTINSVGGGIVNTTLRDFDLPGTQPLGHFTSLLDIHDPVNATNTPPNAGCADCHATGDNPTGPYETWLGSMMAHASVDPLFEACLQIANQDAPESGDLCLRCHIPKAWLNGRSTPTDGRAVLATDRIGVACDICHRMVDPIADNENPAIDTAILAALGNDKPGTFGNGMFVIDPDDPKVSLPKDDPNRVLPRRRGPFEIPDIEGHLGVMSKFHRDAAFCGTCHDVSNPAFKLDGTPNDPNKPADGFSPKDQMPIERTYSEWLHSVYATDGVEQPEFAGNKADKIVKACQDCHMPDADAVGCNVIFDSRPDMPVHDLTGGSVWLPPLLVQIPPYSNLPQDVRDSLLAALNRGALRARSMLRRAATMELDYTGDKLDVKITNRTGHKLPTGYPEGRRMWLYVEFRDANHAPLRKVGDYEAATGKLDKTDPELKVYEAKLGLTQGLGDVPAGESFHFVLNNKILKDNRIPPKGWKPDEYAMFGGTPVGATYAAGDNFDVTSLTMPAGTRSAYAVLYYQSTSKEYVEFLRDANKHPNQGMGKVFYDLWAANGKCPPELMVEDAITILEPPPGSPANVVSAVSRKTHGSQEFDIDLIRPLPGQTRAVECRNLGPTTIVVGFHAPGQFIIPTDGNLSFGANNATDEVALSAGTITSLMLHMRQLTIGLKDVPDKSCLTVTLRGLTRTATNPAENEELPETSFKFLVLRGDVDGDGTVNIVDLNTIKGTVFRPINWLNFRSDITLDAIFNIVDLNLTKFGLFNTATCP